MLIPIGVVESEVRRTPWVTIGLLVGLVALFFVGVNGGLSRKQARELEETVGRAAEFWIEHPWLNEPPAFPEQRRDTLEQAGRHRQLVGRGSFEKGFTGSLG